MSSDFITKWHKLCRTKQEIVLLEVSVISLKKDTILIFCIVGRTKAICVKS